MYCANYWLKFYKIWKYLELISFLSRTCDRYYGDMGLDLSVMYKQSAPVPPSTLSLPILLLYSFEAEAAQSRFLDFSGRRQAPRLMVTITDNSQATRSKVRKTIRKAIAEVRGQGVLSVYLNKLCWNSLDFEIHC